MRKSSIDYRTRRRPPQAHFADFPALIHESPVPSIHWSLRSAGAELTLPASTAAPRSACSPVTCHVSRVPCHPLPGAHHVRVPLRAADRRLDPPGALRSLGLRRHPVTGDHAPPARDGAGWHSFPAPPRFLAFAFSLRPAAGGPPWPTVLGRPGNHQLPGIPAARDEGGLPHGARLPRRVPVPAGRGATVPLAAPAPLFTVPCSLIGACHAPVVPLL